MDYKFHKYVMLFFCSLLFILICLSVEDEPKIQNWNNPLVASWLILWSMVCISDFVVPKRVPMFSFHGYIVIFLLGFLFFVWNQRDDRSLFWKELCRAVEGTFYAAVLFCLFCRPESVGFRYIGAYKNPNPFALYLAVTGCIFLCEFDRYIRKAEEGYLKLIIICCSMAAAGFFLYKTQCATAILAFLAAVIIWLAGYLWKGYYKKCKKRFYAVLFLTVLLCIPVFSGLQWGIRTIPHKLNTTVDYPGDMTYMKNDTIRFSFGETVYAAESDGLAAKNSFTDSRIFQKFKNINSVNQFLNGRVVNFGTYLRKLNLFGHKRWPRVYGSGSRYAHNGILAYAYSYGVLTVIPYVLMNLYYLYYAGLYWMRKRRVSGYAYLPLSTGLVFFLENMMDNVDIPFHWIVWYIVTFMMGMLFDFQEK